MEKPLELTNTLEMIIDNFDEIYPELPSHDPSRNLSTFLHHNQQVKIVATDKNLGLAAFDIGTYNEMVLTHLLTPKYELINHDSTLAPLFNIAFSRSRQNLVKLIQNLTSQTVVRDETISLLKSFIKNGKPCLPCFHVLPKLHKIVHGNSTIPSRPIVGATNWFTTPVSKLLSKLLRPTIKTNSQIAANTFDVIFSLHQFNLFSSRILEDRNHPVLIITLDISSLYTNINLQQLINLIKTHNPEFEGLVTYINDHNYFQYDGKTFKQKDGIAMGTNAAPEIANYYLLHLLDPRIISNSKVKLYKRFLDDLLLFWNGTQDEFLTFYAQLNQLIPGITFTHQISSESNEFLDLRIAISSFGNSKPKLSFSTHQKALNKYAYISPKSCHPVHTLKGFIYGELQRYSTNSSNYFFYQETKRMFMKRLLARGFSREFLFPIFQKHKYMQKKAYRAPDSQLNMSIRYSYRPGLLPLSKRIKHSSKRYLQKLIPGTNFIISWKKSPNLFNKLCKSRLTTEQSRMLSRRNLQVFSTS